MENLLEQEKTEIVAQDLIMSNDVGKIAAALAKAQGAMSSAVKNEKNPHLGSNYADLSSIWDSCREALSANEICVVQIPQPGRILKRTLKQKADTQRDPVAEAIQRLQGLTPPEMEVEILTSAVITVLAHSSGQWFKGYMEIIPAKSDAQAAGSATTYARRYSLSAMVGGTAGDDDGEGAMGDRPASNQTRTAPKSAPAPQPAPVAPKPAPTPTKPPAQTKVVDAKLAVISELMKRVNIAPTVSTKEEWQNAVSRNLGIELAPENYDRIIEVLNKTLGK